MTGILATIIEHKRQEVRALREHRSALAGRSDSPRPFIDALKGAGRLGVIAEVKKASPSRGVIRPDFDPVAIARRYRDGEASAISVLTDARFFQGAAEYLTRVRESVELPVLRKDFIIDPLQIEQSASLNADALLLIAACLSDAQMEELYAAAREMHIEPLIEIHNGGELDRAMRLSPSLLGINNRDLATFETDIATTLELMPSIPRDTIVVSESGIFSETETGPLMAAGVQGVLVGESLMRSDDPAGLIRRLRGT
jgi:indole-3-glycerol phosphate synthase